MLDGDYPRRRDRLAAAPGAHSLPAVSRAAELWSAKKSCTTGDLPDSMPTGCLMAVAKVPIRNHLHRGGKARHPGRDSTGGGLSRQRTWFATRGGVHAWEQTGQCRYSSLQMSLAVMAWGQTRCLWHDEGSRGKARRDSLQGTRRACQVRDSSGALSMGHQGRRSAGAGGGARPGKPSVHVRRPRRLSGKKSARGAALSTSASLLRMEDHGLRDRMLIVIER